MSALSSQSPCSPGRTSSQQPPLSTCIKDPCGGRLEEGLSSAKEVVCAVLCAQGVLRSIRKGGVGGTSRLARSRDPGLEAWNPGQRVCIHPLLVQQSLICSINQSWLQFNLALLTRRTLAKQIISINGILNECLHCID